MSDTCHKLSNLFAVVVGVMLAVAVVGVVLLSLGDHLRPLLMRFISESELTAGPLPEVFERFRRGQGDIAEMPAVAPVTRQVLPLTDLSVSALR